MNFKGSPFYAALDRALKHRGLKAEKICRDDAVSRRLLEEYGAIFVAADSVRVPPVCEFAGTEEVVSFQNTAGIHAATIGSVNIELQPAALATLLSARAEARAFNLVVEKLEELVVLVDAASHSGRIKPGQRLLVAVDADGGGWELAPGGQWHESAHPIEDALKGLAKGGG